MNGIVITAEWDRHHWWVRSSSLVSEIAATNECDHIHWWVGSSSLVSEIVITGEWDRHQWWVRSSSLVSEIFITAEWDCHHWWVRSSSQVSEIHEWDRHYCWTEWLFRWVGPLSRVSMIVLFFERDLLFDDCDRLFQRGSLAAAPYGPCLCFSPSIICQRDLVAAASFFCLCHSPSAICLLSQRYLVAVASFCICSVTLLLLLISFWFRQHCGCWSFLSRYLFYSYLSLISGMLSFFSLSLSFYCLPPISKREPVLLLFFCLCLSSLVIFVSHFRLNLRLLLLSLFLSLSFNYLSLVTYGFCVPATLFCPMSVSFRKSPVSYFRETLRLLLLLCLCLHFCSLY